MSWEAIKKTRGTAAVAPNLADYAQALRTFSWDAARAELDGLPGGRGLNIAHEAVDRHALGPRATRVALRCVGARGVRELRYLDLREQTNRFANALRRLGIGPGDRVFSLLGRVPELYVSALGTLKNRSVFCPLFSAFGPEPLRTRLEEFRSDPAELDRILEAGAARARELGAPTLAEAYRAVGLTH